MTKLHYFLILVFYSVLFSCQDKDKFVLEENKADIEQIITAVIEQDSINILKNNKENNAVVGHFRKNDIIKDIDKNEEPTLFSINLDYLMSNDFDEKDSLYLFVSK